MSYISYHIILLIFSGSHLSIGQCLLLMYCWFKKVPQDDCATELGIEKETVRAWYFKCRTICQAKLQLDDDLLENILGVNESTASEEIKKRKLTEPSAEPKTKKQKRGATGTIQYLQVENYELRTERDAVGARYLHRSLVWTLASPRRRTRSVHVMRRLFKE